MKPDFLGDIVLKLQVDCMNTEEEIALRHTKNKNQKEPNKYVWAMTISPKHN